MKIINISDLSNSLQQWFNLLLNDSEAQEIIIKRNNLKDLVMIPLDEYNSLKETNYLLSGKNREVLLKSLQEAQEGKSKPQSLIEE